MMSRAVPILLAVLLSECMAERCYLPLDVMFLQDTTGSLLLNLPEMLNQVSLVKEELESMYPGTHFGVAEFQDKPYFPLGEPTSSCYKLTAPLSSDSSNFTDAYLSLFGSGGADEKEDHFQAIINVVLDPRVGWRSFSLAADGTPAPGSTGGRFVIMITDGLPHIAGDMLKLAQTYKAIPTNLPVNPGSIVDGDADYTCLYHDYPTPQQVKAVLDEHKVTLVTLTPHRPNITKNWRWFNDEFLTQQHSFYTYIKPDTSDFHTSIVKALHNVSHPTPCVTTSS